jgi:CHASE2 domain-containing sensor protein/signal transduction histidine kinase
MIPRKPLPRRPLWSSGVALALACFVSALFLCDLGVFREASNRINDSFFRLRNRGATPSSVVVVAIDDAALFQQGRWPWSRGKVARLVNFIASQHPKAIGLDVLLSEPSDSHNDELLAAALNHAGNVILPAKVSTSPTGPLWIEPLALFARAASGVGHVQALLDEDGVCRRLPDTELSLSGHLPMMAAALVNLSHRQRNTGFRGTDTTVIQPAQVTIDYRGLANPDPRSTRPFRTISAARFFNGAEYDLRQQIVLIGFAGAGLEDELLTPLSYGAPSPGVLIQANMVDTLARSRAIRSANPAGQLLILFIVCALGSKITQGQKGLRTVVCMVGIAFCTYALAFICFVAWGLQFQLGPAFVAEVLVVPLGQLQHILVLQMLIGRSLANLQRQTQGLPLYIAGFLQPQLIEEPSEVSRNRAESKLNLIARTDEQITVVSAFQQILLEAMRDGIAVFDEHGSLLFENRTWQTFFTLCRWQRDNCWSELLKVLNPERAMVVDTNGRHVKQELEKQGRIDQEILIAARLWRISIAKLPATALTGRALTMVLAADLTPQMERDQAREQALQFITHELRTPLVSLQGFAELLQYFPEQAKAAGAAEVIHRESERLVALTTMFLECLRLETTLPVIKPAITDAAAVLRQVGSLAQPLCAASQKRLTLAIPPEKLGVYLDSAMMTGVLLNLIANAIKYGREDTDIQVRAELLEGSVVFSVCNQGNRISEAEIPQLFMPQYRMLENSNGLTGWGIGLAFVKRVMDAHDGGVQVRSNDADTCFQLLLPVHRLKTSKAS